MVNDTIINYTFTTESQLTTRLLIIHSNVTVNDTIIDYTFTSHLTTRLLIIHPKSIIDYTSKSHR